MTNISRIRKEHFVNAKSVNQIAQEFSISWCTAKKYLDLPKEDLKDRGKRPYKKSHIGNLEVIERIKAYLNLEIDNKIKKKQRYTANYMYKKLKSEGIFTGCDRYFRKLVKKIRKQLDQNMNPVKSYLELDFPLGEFLQLDHGPVEIEWQGSVRDAYLFVSSVPGYSLRFCQLYLTKGSEAWGQFHEESFQFFGGVFNNCIYDNDTVLKSGDSKTTYFADIENHYKFESVFCNKASGWEKGSVENAVGFCRRNYLAGRIKVNKLKEINDELKSLCLVEIDNESNGKPLKDYFHSLKEMLVPLKLNKKWGVWHDLKVNSYQYFRFQGNDYSVPEKLVGSIVKVFATPDQIEVYYDNELHAVHDREFDRGKKILEIDHYIDQLAKKPKAMMFSKVVKEKLPLYLVELRDRLRSKLGLDKGNIEFIQVLKLKKICNSDDFESAVNLGLTYGGITQPSIKAFINQLQVTQIKKHCDKKMLPTVCQIDISNDFNLNFYGELCFQTKAVIQ